MNVRNEHLKKDLPLSALLIPTLRCNLRCRYCYVNHSDYADMSMCDWRALYEFLLSYCKAFGIKQIRFLWFGGEPLLYGCKNIQNSLEMQTEIFQYSEIKIRNSIQSNLTLIDKHVCQLLKTYFDGSIGGSFEPLDNSRQYRNRHSANESIEKNIKFLCKEHINLGIVSTLTKRNIASPNDFYSYFKENKISFRVNRAHCPVNGNPSDYLSINEFNQYVLELFSLFTHDQDPTIDFVNFTSIVAHILNGTPLSCNANPVPYLNYSFEADGRITNSCRTFKRTIGNYYVDTPQDVRKASEAITVNQYCPDSCKKCLFLGKLCIGSCQERPELDCMHTDCGYKSEYTVATLTYVNEYLSTHGITGINEARSVCTENL